MSGQWVHLDGGQLLLATRKGAWLQGVDLAAGLFTAPMPPSVPGTLESTRHLLDGAIAVAQLTGGDRGIPPLRPARWAWHLAGQWYCAHHSVALLPEVIERFERDGRGDLAAFARLKLDEEQGHDQYPLADLRTLGYDAEAAIASVPPVPAVAAAVQYARDCVRGPRPVEFLGYVYALERRVLQVPRDWASELDRALPVGARAASGVRLHADEFDQAHVAGAVRFVSGLPAEDRAAIAVGAYRTTVICCASPPGSNPGDDELEQWFSRFALAHAEPRGTDAVQRQGDDP